jgi:CRISPR-associated protein Cas1
MNGIGDFPDSDAPVRVMALRALGYCTRLFYLEEVERIGLANEPVLAGRELHASLLAQEEQGEWSQVQWTSSQWGLTGMVDCLRSRDGVFPYEHKRGKPRRLPDGQPVPWPGDRLQILAYAALVEEALGTPVSEGRIRYHADQVTVRVPFDEQARADLRQAVDLARRLRQSLERPPITANERLCLHCSLAPVCLPEEVRFLDDPEHHPVRLFPPRLQATALHVLVQGATVSRQGDALLVRTPDGQETVYPPQTVNSLLLHGFAQITTQALRLCAAHEIPVHWLTVSGHQVGSLVPTSGQVQRRIRQYRALTDETTRLRLARALVCAKIENHYYFLLRAAREQPSLRGELQPALQRLGDLTAWAAQAPDADSLRGLEGSAGTTYFRCLPLLLQPAWREAFSFPQRRRRPPPDCFNALLSYGYGLLHTAVMRGVLASGLEPALGFFHTPRSAAYPLVLDLLDLFRGPVWDVALLASINRGQWDPQADFAFTKAKVWLSEAGRRKAIQLFEQRLKQTRRHPVLNYSLSYARLIELEARLLEKEWSGEPGLFARWRLR